MRVFSPGKLTFWNFKWLKLDWLNIVHQVRHLFCSHSLAPSSPLEAGVKITFSESTLYCPGLFSQSNAPVTQEHRQSSLLFCRCLSPTENSFQEKERPSLSLPTCGVGTGRVRGYGTSLCRRPLDMQQTRILIALKWFRWHESSRLSELQLIAIAGRLKLIHQELTVQLGNEYVGNPQMNWSY